MRRLMVAGNWKMNGSRQMVAELLPEYVAVADEFNADVLVCPPYSLLAEVNNFCPGICFEDGWSGPCP